MNKKVIHTVFENCVAEFPQQVAVETERFALTYTELNQNANRLAHLLATLNFEKETVAAVFFETKVHQLISLLGTFKSGLIYLPLDAKYKRNHWGELYRTIQPEIILTEKENIPTIQRYNAEFEHSISKVLDISLTEDKQLAFKLYHITEDQVAEITLLENYQDTNLNLEIDGDDSSYIFFTSGSTGTPKAVLGKHKCLSHYVHWESKQLNVTPKDRFGQIISYSFDASFKDVFMSLINGACLCIPDNDTRADLSKLTLWIREKKITLMHMVPTMLRLITGHGINWQNASDTAPFPELRSIMMAGEKLYNKDVLKWRKYHGTSTDLYNFYGTTESTILSTFYKVPAELTGTASEVLCVGQPISNTRIMILNASNELCRVGEKGSIYIRTPFLSKGYYKNDAQTREKFVQNPLRQDPETVYKTGDYGSYDKDRNVIVMGREDGMVKLHGVRIDMNAIESTILELGDIHMTKCMLHGEESQNASLVCFYKSEEVTEEALRDHCLKHLSQYETPSILFKLDEFPINANGKIDSVALRESIPQRLQDASLENVTEAANAMEESLVKLWKEVLDTPSITTKQSFISLGGNSIKQILLRSKIRSTFGINLSIEELFMYDTIALQAEYISEQGYTETNGEQDRIPQATPAENYSLSNEQMRLWATSQMKEESIAHHMVHSYQIEGAFNVEAFQEAVQQLINRHEALRTRFAEYEEGMPVQEIVTNVAVSEIFEHNIVPKNTSLEEIEAHIKEFHAKDFDLSQAPLFRVLVLEQAKDKYILATSMHHIIGDYTSDQIMMTEMMEAYNALVQGKTPQWEPITVTYKDYAQWMRAKLENGAFDEAKDFWKTQLQGIHQESKWYTKAVETNYSGAYFEDTFSEELTQKIKNYCENTQRSVMSVWSAALGMLIHKINGQNEVLIGTPVNLRNHPDLIGKVGLYLNLLPFRVSVDAQDTLDSIAEKTTGNYRKLIDHSMYPFDLIVDEFKKNHSFGLIDRMDIYLNFISDTSETVQLKDVTIQARERQLKQSKFPICIYVMDQENAEMAFRIEYQTNTFSEKEINTFSERLITCMEKIVTNPDDKVHELNLITRATIPTFHF